MMQEFYKLTSAGAAYNLEIGFEPETIEVVNYTKFGTDDAVSRSIYYRGMADAYTLNEIATDDAINRVITATNGFTVTAASSVGRDKSAISAFTAASPGVGTVASTANFTSGDHVKMHGIAGMTELNDIIFEIVVINSTTFSLKDLATGDAINTTSYGTYVAGTNDYLVNLSDVTENSGSFYCTLGTSVIGSDSDVLYITATSGSTYKNLGDIA